MRRRQAKIDQLIRRHGLHNEGAPVDLSPLKEEFVRLIRPIPYSEVPAFAIPPKTGVVTINSPAIVFLNALLPADWHRIYYAHEVAHIVCGHPATERSMDAGQWWHSRVESEAWVAAAQLLIPWKVLGLGATEFEVAGHCRVPVWLAQRYPMDPY